MHSCLHSLQHWPNWQSHIGNKTICSECEHPLRFLSCAWQRTRCCFNCCFVLCWDAEDTLMQAGRHFIDQGFDSGIMRLYFLVGLNLTVIKLGLLSTTTWKRNARKCFFLVIGFRRTIRPSVWLQLYKTHTHTHHITVAVIWLLL